MIMSEEKRQQKTTTHTKKKKTNKTQQQQQQKTTKQQQQQKNVHPYTLTLSLSLPHSFIPSVSTTKCILDTAPHT